MERQFSPVGKHLKIILEKLFEGTEYQFEDIFVQQNDWFTKHEWLEDQENQFIDWLTLYLYENSEARKELMEINIKNKKTCRNTATAFTNIYGWKIKKI